jgi:fluoride ion exporter CrcB/FEX
MPFRFGLSVLVEPVTPLEFPWKTFPVNVGGCLGWCCGCWPGRP